MRAKRGELLVVRSKGPGMGRQRRLEGAMVETSEREMVRKIDEAAEKDGFTSLQPTYEDSVPPDVENDWDHDWEYEG